MVIGIGAPVAEVGQGSGTDGAKEKKLSAKTLVDLRNYFPETWLWQLQTIG